MTEVWHDQWLQMLQKTFQDKFSQDRALHRVGSVDEEYKVLWLRLPGTDKKMSTAKLGTNHLIH